MTGHLTPSEKLIWAGQQLDPDAPLYNMAVAIAFDGSIEVPALTRAYQKLLDASDSLRTVFDQHEGRPVRRVLDRVVAEIEVIDARELDETAIRDALEARTQRTFELDRGLTDLCVIEETERTRLYLNQHHLVTDAWSTGVFFRSLSELYEREVEGGDSNAFDTPPYSEYFDYVQELDSSARLDEAKSHWAATQNESGPLRVYGHAEAGSGRTRRTRVSLDADRAERLREIAGQPPFRGLTEEQSAYHVFATLLLAWVARVSDLEEVSIGTPWHNRATKTFRETLGLFIELYPVRARVDDATTFRSLAEDVVARTRETLRYAVSGASATPGARGYGAVLNYITADYGEFAGRPTRADWIHSGAGDPTHKIRLQVHDFDRAGTPTLDFDLDEEAFDAPAQAWAIDHFLELFDAISSDVDARVRSVPVSTWAEVEGFAPGGPQTDLPTDLSVRIREQAAATPDAVAIVDGDVSVTYAELSARAQALATDLRAQGLGRDAIIGVALERSAELVCALVAVLEAGAAFLPLDPTHPGARLELLLRDANVGHVFCDPEDASRIEALGMQPWVARDSGDDPEPPSHENSADPGDLAYVLYTSGSTGHPKGVRIAREALTRYVTFAAETYAPTGPVRVPLFTSPAFDLTLTSIFLPLVTGGSVVVYRDDPENSGLLVRRVFEDDAVDVVKLTPSHLALVRDLDLSDSQVRTLILGGENLSRANAVATLEAFGGEVELFNEYGPTEATVGCMLHRFDPELDRADAVPIGRPIRDTRIYVLDPAGHPVSRGTLGEICIAGPQVGLGYLNRPELTDLAFGADPNRPGVRMYKTGDLGRWNARGQLEFHGRADDQVKVRGVRLELGEIEAALASHPDVEQCAATVVSDSRSREEHCARCGIEAAHPEAQLDDESICQPCRRYEAEVDKVAAYFGTEDDLQRLLDQAKERAKGPHDSIMLYSGGKDSTYALCRVVEMGARPLVFLLDNGFISEQAKDNVRRVVELLGLELVIGETPGMREIFADSLERHSNVCQGCFKTIYTLAINLAEERGISAIVTGLSRGQIFETRLEDLYRRGVYDPAEVDRTILDARKAYHRMDDAVSRSMDVRHFESDEVLDRMQFIDFYRYCDVTLDEIFEYVQERTPWIRPSDTGRSTNCLINEAGIFVHLTERGFHNYTLPYSWDVRLGHKVRDEALAELDDDLDPTRVREILDEVGYRERPAADPEKRLVAYYVADREMTSAELRSFLGGSLPREAVPSRFVRLDALPLADSGKVDRSALPRIEAPRARVQTGYVEPRDDVERTLVDIWTEVLGLGLIGVHDDFFELGGDSMHCIQIVSTAFDRGLSLSPRDVFANPTVSALAKVTAVGATAGPEAATATADELEALEREFGA